MVWDALSKSQSVSSGSHVMEGCGVCDVGVW